MNFIEAVKYQRTYGTPIRRKTQLRYGIIIQQGDCVRKTICKFCNSKDVYPLDLEDIMADDWETMPEECTTKKEDNDGQS